MGAGSHFEIWIVVAIAAIFVGMLLSYVLVELPGRMLLRAVLDGYEPTTRASRAVGAGIWAVIFIVVYAIAN